MNNRRQYNTLYNLQLIHNILQKHTNSDTYIEALSLKRGVQQEDVWGIIEKVLAFYKNIIRKLKYFIIQHIPRLIRYRRDRVIQIQIFSDYRIFPLVNDNNIAYGQYLTISYLIYGKNLNKHLHVCVLRYNTWLYHETSIFVPTHTQ